MASFFILILGSVIFAALAQDIDYCTCVLVVQSEGEEDVHTFHPPESEEPCRDDCLKVTHERLAAAGQDCKYMYHQLGIKPTEDVVGKVMLAYSEDEKGENLIEVFIREVCCKNDGQFCNGE